MPRAFASSLLCWLQLNLTMVAWGSSSADSSTSWGRMSLQGPHLHSRTRLFQTTQAVGREGRGDRIQITCSWVCAATALLSVHVPVISGHERESSYSSQPTHQSVKKSTTTNFSPA